MKFKSIRWLSAGLLAMCCSLVVGVVGCATNIPPGLMDTPGQQTEGQLPRLAVGDTVTVTLSGIPDPPTAEEKPIQSDGTISMRDIGRVQAAGKTPGELEDYIKDLYVPKVYRHLTVTVQTSSHRVYFVRGEVKLPNQVEYLGPVTVTRAIAAVGDFTDYANRKAVVLIRSDGRRFVLNCKRIQEGKMPDPPVFPGDQIVVPRSLF